MKVAVLVLIVLGLLAAGSAAFLFQWVQNARGPKNTAPETVEVVVAQSDLPARTRLTGENLLLQKVPKTGLPANCLTSPALAIGKVLKVPLTKGEILTDAVCIAKGSVDDLLRPGMLAYAAPFPRDSSVFELLYPGCVVDVFATFPLRERNKGEAVVFPLLQNVQVLAVGTDTVIPATEEEKATSGNKPRGIAIVTLEVNARQVGALQLALKQGSLGLAMRNPTYKGWNPMEPMVVKEGQLTAASETLDPQTLALFGKIQQMLASSDSTLDPNALLALQGPKAKTPPEPNAPPASAVPAGPLPDYIGALAEKKKSAWQMTIIRGQKVNQEEVAVPAVQQSEPNEQAVPQDGDGL
jgi:Flp pilus assembly protein CpaB